MYHACIVHVSCMYRERILMCPVYIYIKIHQDTTRYICRYMYVPLWIRLRYMYLIRYLSCIPHVSSMYPRTSADTCISYVSRMYPACIPRARYIYPDVSDMYPKMYLGLVWDTCKIHAKIKIHVFSWNVTRPDFFSLGICSSSLRDGPSTIVPTYTPLMRASTPVAVTPPSASLSTPRSQGSRH
jgi:hypothetical protein